MTKKTRANLKIDKNNGYAANVSQAISSATHRTFFEDMLDSLVTWDDDVDTDTTLAADSDTLIPSQKAIKAYVDAQTSTGFNPTADVSMNDYKLTDLADGTAAGDAVNKGQLDALQAELDKIFNGVTTLTIAANTVTWDLSSDSPFAVLELTSNVTTFDVTNQNEGTEIILIVKQDATGSRTLATPTGYSINGTGLDINSSGSSYTILYLYNHGTGYKVASTRNTSSGGGSGSGVTDTYATLATLIAGQGGQTEGEVFRITDASGFTDITSGFAYVEYLGTSAGAEADYNIIGAEEILSRLSTAEGNISTNTSDISTNASDISAIQADYLVAADIADFETTTQLNARDTANRDRANHTGTQAQSTITGLVSDLAAKASDADLTTLEGRVNDAETDITTNAGNISTNSTSINNINNSLDNRPETGSLNLNTTSTVNFATAQILNVADLTADRTIATLNNSSTRYPYVILRIENPGGFTVSVDAGLSAIVRGESDTVNPYSILIRRLGGSNFVIDYTYLAASDLSNYVTQGELTLVQNDVTALDGRITTNEGDITALESDVATNIADIGTLEGDVTTLQGDVSTNASNISGNASDITTINNSLDDRNYQGVYDFNLGSTLDFSLGQNIVALNGLSANQQISTIINASTRYKYVFIYVASPNGFTLTFDPALTQVTVKGEPKTDEPYMIQVYLRDNSPQAFVAQYSDPIVPSLQDAYDAGQSIDLTSGPINIDGSNIQITTSGIDLNSGMISLYDGSVEFNKSGGYVEVNNFLYDFLSRNTSTLDESTINPGVLRLFRQSGGELAIFDAVNNNFTLPTDYTPSSSDSVATKGYVDANAGSGSSAVVNYASIAAMTANQASQTSGALYIALDASADPNVTSGWALYQWEGVQSGSISDYRLIAKEEDLDDPTLQQVYDQGSVISDPSGNWIATLGSILWFFDSSQFQWSVSTGVLRFTDTTNNLEISIGDDGASNFTARIRNTSTGERLELDSAGGLFYRNASGSDPDRVATLADSGGGGGDLRPINASLNVNSTSTIDWSAAKNFEVAQLTGNRVIDTFTNDSDSTPEIYLKVKQPNGYSLEFDASLNVFIEEGSASTSDPYIIQLRKTNTGEYIARYTFDGDISIGGGAHTSFNLSVNDIPLDNLYGRSDMSQVYDVASLTVASNPTAGATAQFRINASSEPSYTIPSGYSYLVSGWQNDTDLMCHVACLSSSYIEIVYYPIGSSNISVPVPGQVQNLSATPDSDTEITLTWDNLANEDNFEIERSLDGSTGWTNVQTVGADVLTWQDTGLTASTQYYYRVRATNAGGNGAYSAVDSATTNAAVGNFAVILDPTELLRAEPASGQNFATETDGLYIGFRIKAAPITLGDTNHTICRIRSGSTPMVLVDYTDDTEEFRMRIGSTAYNVDFFRWQPGMNSTDYQFFVIGIPASGILTAPADVFRWNNGVNETGTFLASGGTWDHNSALWQSIDDIQLGDLVSAFQSGDMRLSQFFMLKGSLTLAEVQALHDAGNNPWSGLSGDGAAAYSKLTSSSAVLYEFEGDLTNSGGSPFPTLTPTGTITYE